MAVIKEAISINSLNTTTTTPTISVGDSGFEEKNKGGLIGGIGYLGEKVASGAVQSIEGISDYAIGGIAKLFGFDKFAERQFRNDWFGDWYERSGDWFNAGKGWQVAGDVAGGIGTSLPAMAAALGITLATAGAGAGASAAILAKGAGAAASFLTAGLGAAGNATKEAYRDTGNLGGKEFGYGALTGGLEGGLEGLTNLIGIGGGAAISHIAKSTAKGATLSALRNGIGATMAKSFLGEAFEEGVSEIFNAPFKRLTYDKDAEGTTASQVLYASLIGGLSGLVMGSTSVFSTARNIGRGQQIAEQGETEGVLAFAEEVTRKAEAENLGDIRQYKQVAETYKALTESLKKTNGEVKTAAQKRMLGELKIDNIAAVFTPKMLNETRNVLNNVDLIAEVYSTVDDNGNKVTYTKEQLLEGVDLNNLRETLPKALETNEALRKVVFDSIAGQMIMDANAFQEAIISGKRFAGEADLERFRIEATTEQKREVERLLDIDNIDTVDSATFNAKAQAFIDGGKRDEFLELNKQMEARKAESTPLSSELSTTEATVEATSEATTTPKSADITSVPLREAMDFATKNVKEYKNLDSENQARIRRLIRQMKANGFTDAQTKAYARVSARSNIDIVVGKSDRLYRGNGKYADGLYSAKENRIYVNPEGSRSPARLLVHELTHAIYKTSEGEILLEEGARNLSEEEKNRIVAKYFADDFMLTKEKVLEYADELNAHYVEAMLDDEALLEKLCEDNPTLPDKILSFFKKAITGYSDEPTLSREAKKLYKRYKTLFEMFAEKNQYGAGKGDGERYAYAGEKARTADKLKLDTAKDMLSKGIDSETVRKETGWFKGYDGKWRFEISDFESSLIEDPHLKKNTDDGEVYFTGKLSDIFNHKELFEAYPELKDINIIIQKTDFGIEGIYQPNSNYITLSIEQFKRYTKKYYDFLNGDRKAEIERIEQSPEYKEMNSYYDDEVSESMEPEQWLKEEQIARDKFYSSEIGKRYYQLRWGKEPFVGEKFEFGWNKGAKEVLLHELQHAVQKIEGFASGTNTHNKDYDINAGEVEARDTANRANLTAEQRKNTRPDIDRTDVVFADGSSVKYYAKNEKNQETESVRQQLFNHIDEINKMEPVANIEYNVINKERAKSDAFSLYKSKGLKVDRQNFGIIEMGENEIDDSSRYANTPSEFAAWMAVPNVLKRGRLISGHENHKNEGFPTYTIAAPVVINGQRGIMGVVVKKTGKYRYKMHRILMPDGSNYVYINNKNAELTGSDILLKTKEKGPDISSASKDSISQNPKKSTVSAKKVSTNSDDRSALPDTDSEGNAISAKVREYFADSKVVDSNGRLMVMYHGSREAFTIFDKRKAKSGGTYGKGFYFTNSTSHAGTYGELYKVYLNITNPLQNGTNNITKEQLRKFVEALAENEDYGIDNYGYGSTVDSVVNEVYGKSDFAMMMDLNVSCVGDMVAAIELFNEVNGTNYDGIIAPTETVAFYPEQVKRIDNQAPTKNPDIRYALPDDEIANYKNVYGNEDSADFDADAVIKRGNPRDTGKANITVGELRKIVANNTKQKVYSKKDALSVVNKFSGISGLDTKTRNDITDAVWQILNEAPDIEHRQDIAHDMAEFVVAKVLVDSKSENPDVIEAQETLLNLRGGINKLAFTEQDISEILHRVDKDGLKRIRSRWGYKARKDANGNISTLKTPLDVYVTDVARQVQGMEYLEDMHPVDAFLEIDAIYSRALKDSKDKWISTYWDMPDSEIPNMIKSVEEDIMNAFANEGSQSKFSKYINGRIEYYSEKADFWKSEYDKLSGRNRLIGLLMSKAQRMKDLKLGTFANSTQFESDAFKNSIGQLARINYRGSLNQQGTRGILKTIKEWYTSESVKENILGVTEDSNGLYVQGVATMLETLTTNDVMDKGFSKEDLTTLYDVMSYFTNFIENWGKIYKRGRWVEAKPIAERFVDIIKSNESLKTGLFMRVASSSYMQTFGDPMTVARQFDRCQDGFYTDILSEMRDAAVDAQVAEMEIRSDYDAFLDKNPKYIQKASTESVTYRGLSIPRIKLIGLYMTIKRKHSWLGLAENGFAFVDAEGTHIRASGVAPASTKTEADLAKAIKGEQEVIEKLLTDADKEYIAILEKGFNEDAKKLKSDRDMQKYGFTNARSDYYYPIRRGGISENVDTDFKGELDRVSNASFNKDTVQGARQELYIESADSVYNRHIHAVCQYAHLSPAVESYNTLYNMDISGNPNKSVSIATESKNTWEKGNAYFKKLFSDIQGIPATSSEGMKALSFVRGGYAKFQLGANPKVWLTQLSSLFASSSLLDGDSITKGMTLDAKDVDKYCSLAKLRNYDNTAANAQGVLDTKTKRTMGAIGKIGDVLMSPIGKMDRFTVGRLFGACQVQVEKNGGAKVGTEANKIEAGKLLRKVILETQQNSIATERSAAMRSGNEIVRTLTMFTSDSMKVVGRVIDSIGEVSVLKARIRTLADGEAKTELQGKLKEANRKARKSVGALCMTAAYMAGIAQLFRWIYDKEQDEDETVAETMLVDAVGNLFGGLPLIKDAYGKIFEGYDINNFTYSALNDIIESAMGLFDAAGNIIKGEGTAQERNLAIRNLSYSTGQLLGIPTRNVYNVLYGLTKRFSPTTAFKIDNAFYEKNYKTELSKAIQNGDEKMTTFIMSLLMGERLDETVDETVFNEILKLTKNGQKVLPREIPDTVTIDGVEYPLTSSQIAEVQKSYAKSQQALKSLFAKSVYNSLDDEAKAEAIDFVYDTYYDKALVYTLGADKKNNNVILSNAIGVDTLALAYLTTKDITSDTDKKGNVISGSKRKKIVSAITSMNIPTEQKLLLIASKGYALQDGDIRGLSGDAAKKKLLNYILKLNIPKEERIRLAEMCGFEVKNGKIIMGNSKK